MNYTTTDEHVPEAERNNQTIAERIRCAYHNLPYKAILKLMLCYLSMVSTKQLNLFPAKGGVSSYLSPHVILGGRNIDYNKHCQVPFGAYVQAVQENNPKNTNAPRTIDAIYLRPVDNIQGGHELMDLNSGRLITRPRVVEIPITNLVIKAVEAMAEEQGIKSLKLQNRRKTIFYPANWIAGVDYMNDNDNDDYTNENDDDNDNDNDDVFDNDENEIETDNTTDDAEQYDHVDQQEIEEIFAEDPHKNRQEPRAPEEANPAGMAEEEEKEEEATQDDVKQEPEEEANEQPQPERVQPARNRKAPECLTYAQTKHVEFDVTVDAENVEEYNPQ
ncbi:MAG: hypothetical protein ACP5GF_13725, partial [Thiomonas sp.]